jgi:hypothetical protein
MIKNLTRLDAFRRHLPARIAPAHSNDNRPPRRLIATAARQLACRWQVSRATGRLECRWGLEPVDGTAAEMPIRRPAWGPMKRPRAAAAA